MLKVSPKSNQTAWLWTVGWKWAQGSRTTLAQDPWGLSWCPELDAQSTTVPETLTPLPTRGHPQGTQKPATPSSVKTPLTSVSCPFAIFFRLQVQGRALAPSF